MFSGEEKNQENSLGSRHQEEIAEILSGVEKFSAQGAETELVHRVESTASPGSSYEIRTTLTSDLIEGQEEPISTTQSLLVIDENKGKETLLINIDNDTSDAEYGVSLFIDFDALGSLDISNIDEKDFEGYEVMIAALRAAKDDRKAFEAQEPFWKRRFISDILKKLEI